MSTSSFPGQIDNFEEKESQETIRPEHVNKLQDAVYSLEQEVARLAGVLSSQQTFDLFRVTGGESTFTLADAKAHANSDHGSSLKSLLKGENHGAGTDAEALFDRTIEDIHLNRNLFLVANSLRTVKETNGSWTVSWDQPLKVVFRNKEGGGEVAVPAASFTNMGAGDALYIALPRSNPPASAAAVKATLTSVPFSPDGNAILVLGYFNGTELVLRNGISSQIRNYQIADDAGINAKKIHKDLYTAALYGVSMGGKSLDAVLNDLIDAVIDIDQRFGDGVMRSTGGVFMGPVVFMPGGLQITRGPDNNGQIIFGETGTSTVTDTASGLKIVSSKRIDLDAVEGVWLGGQNLRAPGSYDVTLSDAGGVAGDSESYYTVNFGVGNDIPVFPSGTVPQIGITDVSNPGSNYFMMRVHDVTNASCRIYLKNPTSGALPVANKYRLFILT